MARLGRGIGSICGVVAASTAAEMAAAIRAGLRETPTIELRLDWLSNDNERTKLLAWLKAHRPANATFLATCRRKGAGGLFPWTVSLKQRLAKLPNVGLQFVLVHLILQTVTIWHGISSMVYFRPHRDDFSNLKLPSRAE